MTKIIKAPKYKYIGINHRNFTIELDEPVEERRRYKIGDYDIFIWGRAKGEGYQYEASYMTADASAYILSTDELLNKELI